ncbi:alpha/beta fold hydrolase [Caulobacter sp.]|uniref:alpha/beta hydrolase family protein n=1 Tax=Caulobacter sp. TaxID=78 RepID=UPI001B196C8C|nr:alpha/beta fold hydrolase [Caulobacter sp.]MBO9543741.1 alpha/beta fold hydrolase [Caulobacter sp.]
MRFLPRAVVAAALLAPAIAMAQVAPIAGDWYGTLDVGVKLPLVFHLQADGTASVDSPAQKATGLKATATLAGDQLTVTLTAPAAAYEGKVAADRKSITGQWVQNGGRLPLTLERAPQAVVAPKRPQTPKPPFPYRAEDVTYTNPASGLTLAGTLTLPPGDGPFPVALLISGSGPQDRDETLYDHKPFLVLADALTRRGVAVLRVDDRGVGGSQPGDVLNATTLDFATDVAAGVAYLRGRKDIDPARVGLIGHSEGGVIAPLVAAKDPRIAFLVLMAGTGVPGDQVLPLQYHDIYIASGASEKAAAQQAQRIEAANAIVLAEPDQIKANPQLLALLKADPQTAAGLTALINSTWYRTFLTVDPARSLAQVRAPVLAINGAKDTQVSAAVNIPAIKAALAGNADTTTLVLPDLNHLFQTARTGAPAEYANIEETIAPSALATVVDWTVAHSKPR